MLAARLTETNEDTRVARKGGSCFCIGGELLKCTKLKSLAGCYRISSVVRSGK